MANDDWWRDDRGPRGGRGRNDDWGGWEGVDAREAGRGRPPGRDRSGAGDHGFGRDAGPRGGYDRPRDDDRFGYGPEPGRDHGRGGGFEDRGYGSPDFGYGRATADRSRHSGPFGRGRGDDRGYLDRASDEVTSWFGDDEAEGRRRMDARQGDAGAQHHRGRGPKGYQRSDERIREEVNERLTDDPQVDASDIDVEVSNREVTLSGTVDSRSARRRAEDLVESISGVTHVQNNLRVRGVGGPTHPGPATQPAGDVSPASPDAPDETGQVRTTGSFLP